MSLALVTVTHPEEVTTQFYDTIWLDEEITGNVLLPSGYGLRAERGTRMTPTMKNERYAWQAEEWVTYMKAHTHEVKSNSSCSSKPSTTNWAVLE